MDTRLRGVTDDAGKFSRVSALMRKRGGSHGESNGAVELQVRTFTKKFCRFLNSARAWDIVEIHESVATRIDAQPFPMGHHRYE
jgi:hypothetical protein